MIWERSDVIKLPIGALFRCGEQWCVFTVERKRAIQHVVQIGQRNSEEAEMLDGPDGNQIVIVYPPGTLTNNARVLPR